MEVINLSEKVTTSTNDLFKPDNTTKAPPSAAYDKDIIITPSPTDPIPPPSHIPLPLASTTHTILCYDPQRKKRFVARDILLSPPPSNDDDDVDDDDENGRIRFAYWKDDSIHNMNKNTIFGHIEIRRVLTQQIPPTSSVGGSLLRNIVWKLTSELVAIKVYYPQRIQLLSSTTTTPPPTTTTPNITISENHQNEIHTLLRIGKKSTPHNNNNNNNILGCVDILRTKHDDNIHAIMPYCDGGELLDHVKSSSGGGLAEDVAKRWMFQILNGMKYLHVDLDVAHLDLSLENILLKDEDCFIIDFGLSLQVPSSVDEGKKKKKKRLLKSPGCRGKQRYVSPELWKNTNELFDPFASDMWSCGVILFVMIAGNSYVTPFDSTFELMTNRLTDLLDAWNVKVSKECMDLMSMLLRLDPEERLGVEDALGHSWFDDLDDDE